MKKVSLKKVPLRDSSFVHWFASQRCCPLASSQHWPVTKCINKLSGICFTIWNEKVHFVLLIMRSFLHFTREIVIYTFTIQHKNPDPPQAQGFWAQASESLTPPAGLYCPCHHLSAPWSTGQILHTYSGMRFLSPVAQCRTTPPLHRTPGPECTLQHRRKRGSKRGDRTKYETDIVYTEECAFVLVLRCYVSLALKQSSPRQANPAAEEARPAAVGKLLTEQMWTLWDKSKLGSPSLRLFLANRRTKYKKQKRN